MGKPRKNRINSPFLVKQSADTSVVQKTAEASVAEVEVDKDSVKTVASKPTVDESKRFPGVRFLPIRHQSRLGNKPLTGEQLIEMGFSPRLLRMKRIVRSISV